MIISYMINQETNKFKAYQQILMDIFWNLFWSTGSPDPPREYRRLSEEDVLCLDGTAWKLWSMVFFVIPGPQDLTILLETINHEDSWYANCWWSKSSNRKSSNFVGNHCIDHYRLNISVDDVAAMDIIQSLGRRQLFSHGQNEVLVTLTITPIFEQINKIAIVCNCHIYNHDNNLINTYNLDQSYKVIH